jgi:hypothetical protein
MGGDFADGDTGLNDIVMLKDGWKEKSVMISELSNHNGIIFNFIDNAMVIGDSTRPISREAMFQRFRLSYSLVRHPFNISN